MSSILKNRKTFKPVFLYSNKDYSKRLIDQLKAEEETIKTAIQSIKKLRPHLKDEVIVKCLKNGFELLSEVIKEDHKDYPYAEIKTLLSLEGIKPDLVDEVKTNLSKIKKNRIDEYNISGVEVSVKPATIKEIEKQSERYTTSEDQNEALDLLKTIAENVNKGIEKGLIKTSKVGAELNLTNELLAPFDNKMKLKRLEGEKWGIQPDPYRISML